MPRYSLPWADLGIARARQAREHLRDVIEIVNGPCRQQLAHRHLPEGRMQAAPVEIGVRDEGIEPGEVLGAQGGESLHELVEGRAGITVGVGEAVERVECPRRAVLDDPPGARDPVLELRADEVADRRPADASRPRRRACPSSDPAGRAGGREATRASGPAGRDSPRGSCPWSGSSLRALRVGGAGRICDLTVAASHPATGG